VERRPLTTVPQQALFGMNHPFVVAQAKALAARTEESASAEQRAASLYRRALGRLPDVSELEVSLRFVGATDARLQLDGMEQLAQVLLLTNEAMFID
jgi:hypothetical protein